MAEKLTISQDLYDEALRQVLERLLKGSTYLTADNLRSDAKFLLDRTLWMAYEHHRDHPPVQMGPSPLANSPHMPEHMKRSLQEKRDGINKQVVENHRSSLIKLVKLNDEMTVEVATKLVDEILALA